MSHHHQQQQVQQVQSEDAHMRSGDQQQQHGSTIHRPQAIHATSMRSFSARVSLSLDSTHALHHHRHHQHHQHHQQQQQQDGKGNQSTSFLHIHHSKAQLPSPPPPPPTSAPLLAGTGAFYSSSSSSPSSQFAPATAATTASPSLFVTEKQRTGSLASGNSSVAKRRGAIRTLLLAKPSKDLEVKAAAVGTANSPAGPTTPASAAGMFASPLLPPRHLVPPLPPPPPSAPANSSSSSSSASTANTALFGAWLDSKNNRNTNSSSGTDSGPSNPSAESGSTPSAFSLVSGKSQASRQASSNNSEPMPEKKSSRTLDEKINLYRLALQAVLVPLSVHALHSFEKTSILKPVNCHACKQSLMGCPGMSCEYCHMRIHEKCVTFVYYSCHSYYKEIHQSMHPSDDETAQPYLKRVIDVATSSSTNELSAFLQTALEVSNAQHAEILLEIMQAFASEANLLSNFEPWRPYSEVTHGSIQSVRTTPENTDTYVFVASERVLFHTNVIRKSDEPSDKEAFTLPLFHPGSELVFSVFDASRVKEKPVFDMDGLLGQTSLQLAKLTERRFSGPVVASRPGKTTSIISLSLELPVCRESCAADAYFHALQTRLMHYEAATGVGISEQSTATFTQEEDPASISSHGACAYLSRPSFKILREAALFFCVDQLFVDLSSLDVLTKLYASHMGVSPELVRIAWTKVEARFYPGNDRFPESHRHYLYEIASVLYRVTHESIAQYVSAFPVSDPRFSSKLRAALDLFVRTHDFLAKHLPQEMGGYAAASPALSSSLQFATHACDESVHFAFLQSLTARWHRPEATVQQLMEAAVTRCTSSAYTYAFESIMRSDKDKNNPSKWAELSDAISALTEFNFKHYAPLFSDLVDIKSLSATHLVLKLWHDLDPYLRLQLALMAATNVHENFFALYFKIQRLDELCKGAIEAGKLGYHDTFHSLVAKWLKSNHAKTLEWCISAVEVDTFDRDASNNLHSSSIVDVFCNLDQSVTFLEDLKWPDENELGVFALTLAKTISNVSMEYAEAVACKTMEVMPYLSQPSHQIYSRKVLVGMNNLQVFRRKLDTLYKVHFEKILFPHCSLKDPQNAVRRRVLSNLADGFQVLTNVLNRLVGMYVTEEVLPKLELLVSKMLVARNERKVSVSSSPVHSLAAASSSVSNRLSTLSESFRTSPSVSTLFDFLSRSLSNGGAGSADELQPSPSSHSFTSTSASTTTSSTSSTSSSHAASQRNSSELGATLITAAAASALMLPTLKSTSKLPKSLSTGFISSSPAHDTSKSSEPSRSSSPSQAHAATSRSTSPLHHAPRSATPPLVETGELVSYLDEKLSSISDVLYHTIFMKILRFCYLGVLSTIDNIWISQTHELAPCNVQFRQNNSILRSSKSRKLTLVHLKSSLPKLRPSGFMTRISPAEAKALRKGVAEIQLFFHAEGDGLRSSQLRCDEYERLKGKLKALYRM